MMTSSADDRPVDVDSISDADISPEQAADKFTKDEIKKRDRQGRAPSPTEMHRAAVAHHIDDLKDERDRLRLSHQQLQKELDQLRPSNAALQEAYRASLASNIFSTVMVGLGGALISGAGYIPNAKWKSIALTSGSITLLWGFSLQATSTWRGIRHERYE